MNLSPHRRPDRNQSLQCTCIYYWSWLHPALGLWLPNISWVSEGPTSAYSINMHFVLVAADTVGIIWQVSAAHGLCRAGMSRLWSAITVHDIRVLLQQVCFLAIHSYGAHVSSHAFKSCELLSCHFTLASSFSCVLYMLNNIHSLLIAAILCFVFSWLFGCVCMYIPLYVPSLFIPPESLNHL